MFGEALRAARVEAAMSVSELAERSATSRSAIADYESGRKNPRTDTAERILNALGATLAVANSPPGARGGTVARMASPQLSHDTTGETTAEHLIEQVGAAMAAASRPYRV